MEFIISCVITRIRRIHDSISLASSSLPILLSVIIRRGVPEMTILVKCRLNSVSSRSLAIFTRGASPGFIVRKSAGNDSSTLRNWFRCERLPNPNNSVADRLTLRTKPSSSVMMIPVDTLSTIVPRNSSSSIISQRAFIRISLIRFNMRFSSFSRKDIRLVEK